MRLYFDFGPSKLHPSRSGFVQPSNQERRNAPLPGDFCEYSDPLSAIGDPCYHPAPLTGAMVRADYQRQPANEILTRNLIYVSLSHIHQSL
ncbi:hypothetical protein [Candidatus Nitrotoga sp. AM1P]|uniref:hypothetical protein n=1 Tax=Candidatus Nitrotoga sp. AM1P TaxID=2559597 RepID=UPI00156671CF|nr:hypothetical protein [Candidatus Nitrotoga sp. AM1P]